MLCRIAVLVGAASALAVSAVHADVFNMGGTRDPVTGVWTGQASLEFVTVGDAGNAADAPYPSASFGSVDYAYAIGKYDVTAAQYCDFLNAVAATDTYGLYNTDTLYVQSACKIQRSGSPGSYTYSVAPEWVNRPVNMVSWGDAVRFCNWLQNGQPRGPQNLATTEDGAYYLNGATGAGLMAVTRKAGAVWVLPTDNEWYKAAYYDPNKAGGAGYWTYPTRSNNTPSNLSSAAGANNANYDDYDGTSHKYTIGSPYWQTEVGAFAGSPGPYGTFDQGGNVWQWNESPIRDGRGQRGGSYWYFSYGLAAGVQGGMAPWGEDPSFGFRVASVAVPEPSTTALLLAGALGLLAWRRRAR